MCCTYGKGNLVVNDKGWVDDCVVDKRVGDFVDIGMGNFIVDMGLYFIYGVCDFTVHGVGDFTVDMCVCV